MKLTALITGSALAVASAAAPAQAGIVGLFNTGVDNSGNAVAGAVVDLHWNLNSGPAYTGVINGIFPQGPWVPDSSASRWLTPTRVAADSFDPGSDGYYTYRLAFNLSSSAGARFTGQYAADNAAYAIRLNGNSIGGDTSHGPSYFDHFSGFGAAGGFVAGTNYLDFVVQNFAQNGGNPSGLNVQFLSSAVPETSTWIMMLLGFAGLGFAGYRRNRVTAIG